MDFLSTVERKTLFSLTRILALGVTALVTLGILCGLYVALIGTVHTPSDKATVEEVFQDLGAPGAAKADASPFKDLKQPEQAVFKGWMANDQIRPLLENQLNQIGKEDRQSFLDEIGKVLAHSEQAQKNPAVSIQRFFVLSERARSAHRNAASEHKAEREKAIYGIGIGLGLLALFSLVLVLLAIERNTRTDQAA